MQNLLTAILQCETTVLYCTIIVTKFQSILTENPAKFLVAGAVPPEKQS